MRLSLLLRREADPLLDASIARRPVTTAPPHLKRLRLPATAGSQQDGLAGGSKRRLQAAQAAPADEPTLAPMEMMGDASRPWPGTPFVPAPRFDYQVTPPSSLLCR